MVDQPEESDHTIYVHQEKHLEENLGKLDLEISDCDLDILEDIELPELIMFLVDGKK